MVNAPSFSLMWWSAFFYAVQFAATIRTTVSAVTTDITYRGNEVIQFGPGETLTRTCWSFYESTWVLPDNEQYREADESDPLTDGRASINSTRTPKGWFKLKLTLRDLRRSDTGFYTCQAKTSAFNDVTIASGNAPQPTRVYVLVSGRHDDQIFLHRRDDEESGRVIPVWNNRDSFVSCLVTRLDAELKLTIDGVPEKHYTYDPRYGFLVPVGSVSFDSARSGRCLAQVNGNGNGTTTVTDKVQVLLLPIRHADLLKPNIILASDPYPYKNGRLNLHCVYPDNSSNPAIRYINCSWINIPDKTGVRVLGPTTAVNRTAYIKRLKLSHSGNYTCACNHVLDDDMETVANYYVRVSETKGRIFHLSPATSTTAERSMGESVRFAVRSTAWPERETQIRWFHRYRDAFSQPKMIELAGNRQKNVLNLRELRVNDSGLYAYRITAGGDLRREVLFSLLVYGQSNSSASNLFLTTDANDVNQTVDSRYLELNASYYLYCLAEGHPKPKTDFMWSPCVRENSENEQCSWREIDVVKERIVITEGDFQKAMRLETTAHNSKRYACQISDWTTNETVSFHSIVYVVSDIEDAQRRKSLSVTLITADSTGEIYETDSIIATCRYQPIVYTTVRWKYMSPADSAEWLPVRESKSADDSLLLVRSVSRLSATADMEFTNIRHRHEGTYACVGTIADDMGGGQELGTFQIFLNETAPLRFGNSSSLKQLSAAVGYGPVEIFCDAYGAPSPTITWLKDGAHVYSNATTVQLSNGNRTLTILHPTVEDEGRYACRLENRFESVSNDFMLRISTANTTSSRFLLSYWTYALVVVLVLFAFIIMLLSICLYLSRRRKKQAIAVQMSQLREVYAELMMTSADESPQLNPDQPVNEQTGNLRYDPKFEIPIERLTLGRLLGEGQFGRVYEAVYSSSQEEAANAATVAVKTPKVGTNADQQKALLSEFKIMSYIGDHVNVLHLVGAVTKHIVSGRLYVVMDHCRLGSLSDYLRRQRDNFVDELVRSSQDDYESSVDVDGYLVPMHNNTTKEWKAATSERDQIVTLYERYRGEFDSNWSRKHAEDRLEEGHLATSDLLSFAFQVANGMEYLASKKILHRDLALRNVLLNEHKVVKICDFGLARHDYTYHTTKMGIPLPVKWMAIESILFQEYTEKSDLWSFGIVTWEIFSLAETPYAGQAVDRNFIIWLKNEANRMPCPEYASEPMQGGSDCCMKQQATSD